MSDETNDEINEKNKIKKIESINFPTFKEGETWETIGEKLVQASFIQKPLEALEEINENLISTMNDNITALNNKIGTLEDRVTHLTNSKSYSGKHSTRASYLC
ncbi:MAG: hypothetical protein KTV77_00680 [Wolbachia endosymbiont of Fragariocoptes setiger]|nr:hypothetical protein [Wolbachia endosymbiont of Fragariocoptes setiger]